MKNWVSYRCCARGWAWRRDKTQGRAKASWKIGILASWQSVQVKEVIFPPPRSERGGMGDTIGLLCPPMSAPTLLGVDFRRNWLFLLQKDFRRNRC
jgi:hypothetical protein